MTRLVEQPAATIASKPATSAWLNIPRLTLRQWAVVLLVVGAVVVLVPILWQWLEPFPTGVDYRIPYDLSKDYWLYERRLAQLGPGDIAVLGDSVVWGEYVRPDGTLSHFLNEHASPHVFANAGINGLFPLAMNGLVASYGRPLTGHRVILHCNLLWMSSPRADLSSDREEPFNHSRLVPQFSPAIPCYRADTNERLGAVIERNVPFLQWVNHLQIAYFGGRSLPQWTLAEDGNEPPGYPNAWRNPLAALRHGIPTEPAVDPQRGPSSRRHRPWTADAAEPTSFEWVPLDRSLQWRGFQSTVASLQARHCDLLVIVGPLNEHMIVPEQRAVYETMRGEILDWLREHHVPALAPPTLPSELYADASHPLTEGYDRLARHIANDPVFRAWLARRE